MTGETNEPDIPAAEPLSSGGWLALTMLFVAVALGWRFLILPVVAPIRAPAAQASQPAIHEPVVPGPRPGDHRVAANGAVTVVSDDVRTADRPAPKTHSAAQPRIAPARREAHVASSPPKRASWGTLTYRDDDRPRSIRVDGITDDGWVRGRAVDDGPRGSWRVARCWDGARVAPCLVPRRAALRPRSSESARRRAALAWRGTVASEDDREAESYE